MVVCALYACVQADALTFEERTITILSTNTTDSDQRMPGVWDALVVWEDRGGGTRTIVSYAVDNGAETNLPVAISGDDVFSPALYGDWAAWVEYGPMEESICLYNTVTGELRTLDSDPGYNAGPSIWGDSVVWADDGSGVNEILLYTISTGSTQQITDDSVFQCNPDIWEDRIVWETRDGLGDIVLYNITTDTSSVITAGTPGSDQMRPGIYGDRIVFENKTGMFVDVAYYEVDTGDTVAFTPGTDYTDQKNPAIWGDRIVWEDWRDGSSEIYLLNTSTGEEWVITTDVAGDQLNPSIWENRIVWEQWQEGRTDIYLCTLGISAPPLIADFDADPTIGSAPLEVVFMDTSSVGPETWRWEFGDGNTSSEQSPVHTYTANGLYSVTLTVSNPYYRNATWKQDIVVVGAPPRADFSSDVTGGGTPCTVAFTDQSTGNPETWNWSFGDGATSTLRHPVHTYLSPGVYSVSLTVGNAFGNDTCTVQNMITVIESTSSTFRTDIEGIAISMDGPRERWSVNTTLFPHWDLSQNGLVLDLSPVPGYGISAVRLYANNTPGFTWAAPDVLEGYGTGVVFESIDVGREGVPCTYRLSFPRYPLNATIETMIWDGAVPADIKKFEYVAFYAGFTSIRDVAYTAEFECEGTAGGSAMLVMGVDAAWVSQNGGREKVWAIRLGDDLKGEVLPTRFTMHDPGRNLDYFMVDSPRGFSKIALASLSGSGNPLQLIYLTVEQVMGGDEDYPYPELPQTTESFLPPIMPFTPEGLLSGPISFESEDKVGRIEMGEGTKACDCDGNSLENVEISPIDPESLPPLPSGTSLLPSGYAYTLGPDGSRFDPPVMISFCLPEEEWNQDTRYTIWWWNEGAEEWDPIPTFHTAPCVISGMIDHFSIFALFMEVPLTEHIPVQATPPAEQQEPSPTVRETHITITGGLINWVVQNAQKNPLIIGMFIVLILVSIYWHKKRYG